MKKKISSSTSGKQKAVSIESHNNQKYTWKSSLTNSSEILTTPKQSFNEALAGGMINLRVKQMSKKGHS